jgi:hypothetical protein
MALKTNEGLVAYAKSKLTLPTIYMLGGFGRKLTEANIQRRLAMPCAHTTRNVAIIRAGIGKYWFDCVGLMKGYLWETSPGVVPYNIPVGSDQNVGGMYASSPEKGPLSTMPDIPGLLVFTGNTGELHDFGHVGLYVGKVNGINQYIEATPAWGAWGVTTSAASGHPQGHNRTWTHWGKYSYVDYTTYEKRIAAEKALAVKLAAEKLAAEKALAEKLAAEKLAAEKLAAEKLAAEKAAADKLAAEKALAAAKLAQIAAAKAAAEAAAAKNKISVGSVVYFSGYIYRDSFGFGKSKNPYPKTRGVVDIMNKRIYGVHIKGLGWVTLLQVQKV